MNRERRIKCFWMVPLEKCRYWARTYEPTEDSQPKCPVTGSFHNASVLMGDGEMEYYDHSSGNKFLRMKDEPDPPWNTYPKVCDCGYTFTRAATRHVLHRQLYKRADTGEEVTVEEAPVGAMWNSWWYGKWAQGSDGMSLTVKTPGGEWVIDNRCSNCTLPDDNVHKCWVRHGEPPNITVDKNGVTCSAGGGSIAQPGYHGFLRAGYLEEC